MTAFSQSNQSDIAYPLSSADALFKSVRMRIYAVVLRSRAAINFAFITVFVSYGAISCNIVTFQPLHILNEYISIKMVYLT